MATYNITQFKSLFGLSGTVFPDNTTGQISEEDMRQFGEDIADSLLFNSDLLTNTVVDTSLGTIFLPFSGTRDRIFYGSSSFSSSKFISLSSSSNAKRLTFIFQITDTAAILTFPSSFRMSDAMWGANGAYTWQGLDVGTYKAKAEFDGTLWYLDMFGPYGFIT